MTVSVSRGHPCPPGAAAAVAALAVAVAALAAVVEAVVLVVVVLEFWIDFRLSVIDFNALAISFCFFGPYEVEKLKSVGENITESKYIKFLQGRLWQEEMIDIDYDDVTIDIGDWRRVQTVIGSKYFVSFVCKI